MGCVLSLVRRLIEDSINFFIVRIVPVLYHGAIFCFKAMLISLAAIWTGWPLAADRITWEWMGRAAQMGIPSSADKYMFPGMKVIAHAWILFGWMFWAMFTASMINLVLRHYTGWWINF